MSDFGDRLRQAMLQKGMRASDLSAASGVGKSDISNYLNGKYKAKQDKVYMLARALGVDAGWLMAGEDDRSERDKDADRLEALHQNPELGMLFDRARNLPHEDVDKVIRIVDAIFGERDTFTE